MSTISLKFNQAEFQKKFRAHIDSDIRIRAAVNKYADGIFGRAKTALLRDFNNHPITRELREGPEGSNISNTLSGEGNLFAFLGFYEGEEPTRPLEILLNWTNMHRTISRGNHVYFKVEAPDWKQIEDVTQMTWGSVSWCEAIETGAFEGGAELTHFIFRTFQSGSRSGKGIQVKGDYLESDFNPKPYMSEILEKFRERINAKLI